VKRLSVNIERLSEFLACEIRYNFDTSAFAGYFAVIAVFAFGYVFKYRFLVFFIPADYVYKTGFVAHFTTNAVLRVKIDNVFCIYHCNLPPFSS
jgi:hypothetical protein